MTEPEDPRVARSKAAVIEATVALLAERGVAATTIEAIAEQSGVAKTTIYRHWPGKPELVKAALDTLVSPPVDPDTGSLRQDLHVLLAGLASSLRSGEWCAVMPSLVETAERDPEFAAVHHRFCGAAQEVLRTAIARGIARGELRADADPDEVVSLLSGPLFYRRLITHEPVTPSFACAVIDRTLAAYAPH